MFLLLSSSHLQCTLKIKKELIKGLFVNDKDEESSFSIYFCCLNFTFSKKYNVTNLLLRNIE